jgi:hypothetical protein
MTKQRRKPLDVTSARIRLQKAERGVKRARDAFLRHMMVDVPDGSYAALEKIHDYRCDVLWWQRELKRARAALSRAYAADVGGFA